ncbi:MAG: hypothetical protein BWY73_00461 [candidate division TA06 bacterium ADurb.Bin417]|uniref:Uncharacterized protein n=1 Tax=candidate division TA06 bacterium ADurb.Bin417 TaxID=1852828 RepID=A0A1V5MJ45_UNCT6|nr:MAG: hypothetical protein BWY73_00461 [candidate division TA06 bacterium ADurb.Bin417]
MGMGWFAWWMVIIASVLLIVVGLRFTLRGWKDE